MINYDSSSSVLRDLKRERRRRRRRRGGGGGAGESGVSHYAL